jgi:S-DNA-T family DNA segregation ATPase FtsK/SpoIIIE
MDNRYAYLRAHGRRKITPADALSVIVVIVDEIAYYSATIGDKNRQEEFAALLRDLVARGRACALIVVAATQRPSVDIIPTSLRDIFGYRMAFRCTTYVSSDIVLGHGWANQGYSAHTIGADNDSRGIGWLIAEGAIPRKMRVAYLADDDIHYLVEHAARIRHHAQIPEPGDPGDLVPAA